MNNLPQNLSDIEREELLVIFEHLIDQKADKRVLIDIPQEEFEIVVHFHLILDVVFAVHNEEVVALMDQLLVEWIIYRGAVHSILDEKHRQVFDGKAA